MLESLPTLLLAFLALWVTGANVTYIFLIRKYMKENNISNIKVGTTKKQKDIANELYFASLTGWVFYIVNEIKLRNK